MHEHLRHLSQHCRAPISCLPNAGLPTVVDGAMHYDLTPEQLAQVVQKQFRLQVHPRSIQRRLLAEKNGAEARRF